MKWNPRSLLIGALIIIVLAGLGYLYWEKGTVVVVNTPKNATSTPLTATATTTAAHIDDYGQYYTIETAYPSHTPLTAGAGATADAQASASMKQFVEDTIAQFKQDGNFANLTPQDIQVQGLDRGNKYALGITYQTYQSPRTLSYVYSINEDTLGAHPNTTYRTFTFDTATGASLSLSDIFVPNAQYLTQLSQISRAQLPSLIAQMEGNPADADMISQGTTPTSESFQNWYLDGSNFVLLFAPYQVGPYALGPVTLRIPRSKLSAILKPEYQ